MNELKMAKEDIKPSAAVVIFAGFLMASSASATSAESGCDSVANCIAGVGRALAFRRV